MAIIMIAIRIQSHNSPPPESSSEGSSVTVELSVGSTIGSGIRVGAGLSVEGVDNSTVVSVSGGSVVSSSSTLSFQSVQLINSLILFRWH
jgi:hypothetical protein